MPLSEDEQRILRQIEEQLQRDPSFGRDIKPRHVGSRRAVIVSSVSTVLCLVLTVVFLARQPVSVVRRVHRRGRSAGDRRASRCRHRRGRAEPPQRQRAQSPRRLRRQPRRIAFAPLRTSRRCVPTPTAGRGDRAAAWSSSSLRGMPRRLRCASSSLRSAAPASTPRGEYTARVTSRAISTVSALADVDRSGVLERCRTGDAGRPPSSANEQSPPTLTATLSAGRVHGAGTSG